MKLVRRTAWGAPASSAASYIGSTRGVKVHYLGSPYSSREHGRCDDQVRAIRASHLANRAENYADIAYNMLVCEHGYVYEGRGAHKRTGANGNSTLNSRHYAVCALLGSAGMTTPTDAMLHGLRDAIEWLREHGDAGNEIQGHRDGYATACPGGPLYAWVQDGAPRPKASGGGSSPGGAYTVREGDTLWSIAEDKLGSGDRYTEIARLNGLADADEIRAGQELKLPGKTTTKPKPKPRSYEPFPGADFFRPGRRSSIITAMGKRLVAEGCSRYQVGPGPSWTDVDRQSYAAWQRKLGYSGRDADGIPGATSWAKLRVPNT